MLLRFRSKPSRVIGSSENLWEGLWQTGAPGGREAPVLPPSPSLPRGHYHRLGVLILAQPQAVQHWAGDTGQPVGEPLPDGPWVNVLHAAGIDDDIDTLGGASSHQGSGSVPWQHVPPPQRHPPGRTRQSWLRGWHRRICGHLARPHPPVAAREGLS